MDKHSYVHVRVDPELKAQIREEAARRGVSMSRLVRRAVLFDIEGTFWDKLRILMGWE